MKKSVTNIALFICLCVFSVVTFASPAVDSIHIIHFKVVNHLDKTITVKTEPLAEKGCFKWSTYYNQTLGQVKSGDEKEFDVYCNDPRVFHNNNINFWFYTGDINPANDLNVSVRSRYAFIGDTFRTYANGTNGNKAKARITTSEGFSHHPRATVNPL